MPKIPAPEDYAYSSPSPTRGMVEVRPNPLGKVVSGFGEELGKMVEIETQKLDELAAQDALNTLDKERLRRTYDPQDGFRNVQGQAILKSQILKTVPEEFNKQIESIASSLKTPRQQEMFRRGSSRMANDMHRELFQFVAAQTEKASDEITKATDMVQIQRVETDPTALASAIEASMENRTAYLKRTGATDPATIKLNTDSIKAQLAGIALKGFLSGDNPQTEAAAAVLKEYDSVLPRAVVGDANDKIKTAERFSIADTASGDAFEAYKTGAISLSDAKTALGKTAAGDTKMFTVMDQLFRSKVESLHVERAENAGALQMQFIGNKTQANKRKIETSPAFLALDTTTQVKVSEYMEGELDQKVSRYQRDMHFGMSMAAAKRAAQASDEDRKMQTQAAYEAYYKAVNDPELVNKKQGWAFHEYASKWGNQFATKVEKAREEMVSGVAAVKFDPQAINDAIPDEFLKKGKMAEKYAFMGYADKLLSDWKEANKGKIPTEVEKLRILESASKKFVTEKYWGMSKEVRYAFQPKPMPEDFPAKATPGFKQLKGRLPTQQELKALWESQPYARGE